MTCSPGTSRAWNELLAEPSSTQNAAAGMSPRPADTPEPWDAPVGRALMDSHEGVRRLEAVLKYMVAGHPGRAPRRLAG